MFLNIIIAASLFVSVTQPVLGEPNHLSLLSKRQTDGSGIANGIPTQCSAQCQPVVDATTTPACISQGPISCLCTDTLANAFKACLDCAVINDPADVSEDLAQSNIQSLIDGCNAAGHPVTISGASSGTTTFSGGSGSSSSSTTPVLPATTTPNVSSSITTPAASDANANSGAGTGTGTDSTPTSTTTTTNSSAVNLSTYSFTTIFAAVLVGIVSV